MTSPYLQASGDLNQSASRLTKMISYFKIEKAFSDPEYKANPLKIQEQ